MGLEVPANPGASSKRRFGGGELQNRHVTQALPVVLGKRPRAPLGPKVDGKGRPLSPSLLSLAGFNRAVFRISPVAVIAPSWRRRRLSGLAGAPLAKCRTTLACSILPNSTASPLQAASGQRATKSSGMMRTGLVLRTHPIHFPFWSEALVLHPAGRGRAQDQRCEQAALPVKAP